MNGDIAAAVAGLREAFARYPRRAVLDGCPHCRGQVTVDRHDLHALTVGLGTTIGTRDDVKGLLPLLLERLLTDGSLDASLVLGKLSYEHWHTWPHEEQRAVQRYLGAVWSALLATYPARLGALSYPRDFLEAVDRAGGEVDRFLHTWDLTGGPSADRHLADLVSTTDFGARRPGLLVSWLRGDAVRDRLYRAFERDHAEPWADDLAFAHDRVPP